ncbi:hypothetical protein GQF22_06320 [Neisseria meningitidis]|nr:hypothetical protein [Neisseria meningitidis]MBG9009984.1 hypothetical protein [Neisseria meningitidis]MBG9038475.1 hypothetical protein [Neisseria meningitidis]MBG9064271.1 hypothetical protein [Neisseria meningitidis]MBG9069987.1 hypothetical protein [Neisseria meningitidis]
MRGCATRPTCELHGTSKPIRELCKIPFPPDSRNPNTGFRLFSFQISTNFTPIPP